MNSTRPFLLLFLANTRIHMLELMPKPERYLGGKVVADPGIGGGL